MDKTFALANEISKGVYAKRRTTTKLEYFCESESEVKALCANITQMLVKHLNDATLVKITYDYKPADKIVEVEIIEHN